MLLVALGMKALHCSTQNAWQSTRQLISNADGTMMATITFSIGSGFGEINRLSWIATTYAMNSSISQPLSGHLTDVFGRRSGLVVSLTLFLAGTLLCGLSFYAGALDMFLVGRVVAGLGGGSLVSITSFVESDLIGLKNRALVEGVGNVIFGAVNAIGGFYGGSISDAIGWQWAFLIQVPIIFALVVLVQWFLQIPSEVKQANQARKPVDLVGCVCVLVTMVFFQLALNSGSNYSDLSNALVITSFTISSCSLAFLIY